MENNGEVKTSKECLESIRDNSLNVINQLCDYLSKHSNWTPMKNSNELASIDDNTGCYYATHISVGKSGKEPYVWLNIRYKGVDCYISTFWQAVDAKSWNIHHYFGQICFIKIISHKSKKCPQSNTPKTTIEDINTCSDAFQQFLNKHEYKTIRQKNSFTELTVDNFFDDSKEKVTAQKVIDLFVIWAEMQFENQ